MIAPAARNLARAAARRAGATASAQQLPAAGARSLSIFAGAARPSTGSISAQAQAFSAPQARGIKHIDFAGDGQVETVYERADWPIEKLHDYFKNDTLALLGYGSQGHGQGLNLRDQGLNVIVGVRKGGASWKEAQEDGWVEGKNLFDIDEAAQKGTYLMMLMSDAGASDAYPKLLKYMTKGKTVYWSHGFSPVFKDQTGIEAPKECDVILCAPKGSGRTVRTLFKEGRGINSSVAVYQDVTGKALEKAVAMSVAVGSGYTYETTFEKEVYSDLYGERGCLMGGIQGMFKAQYDVLRANGHSPSEAFNETCEEALMSLYPLVGEHGMDYMYKACSTTARRGALDLAPVFEKALKPVFEDLYARVKDGSETRRTISFASQKNYRELFDKETDAIAAQEMWRVGHKVRALRPDRAGKDL
ncbi:ketol-acid reductoisomerase [Ceraceosorus bombacis]|uniref:ketol-acid reductoisomerase (NADP(+)) n=1 Tax=Ceraceosorus bombacis TaxID=401625 RepID=A0A0P1BSL3_9BASI|nr:ketol-acid reductoisomerase [Ceraceosorus bombacis]